MRGEDVEKLIAAIRRRGGRPATEQRAEMVRRGTIDRHGNFIPGSQAADDIHPECLIRRKAGEIPPLSPEHQAEIGTIRDEDIDCSDISERT